MPDMLHELQEEVARARSAFSEAADAFDALVDRMPHQGRPPDGNLQIEQANQAFRAALHDYSRAVKRLHEFVTSRKLPGG
jgi:uncharacterized protein YPO0396